MNDNWFDDLSRMWLHKWLREAEMNVSRKEFPLMLAIFKAGVLQAMSSHSDLVDRFCEGFNDTNQEIR